MDNQDHSAKNKKLILQVTWTGLGINFLLAIIKLIVGYFGNSKAVIADAVHSFSDMATDLAIIFGVRFWSTPADENHPYGHFRIETIVTILIASILLLVGVGIGYDAIATIQSVHNYETGKIAILGCFISIIAKEWLYRWTSKVGKEAKSPATIANAWHHRSDALSSIPALISVSIAVFYPQWAFVDHIGAIIVSMFIAGVAWKLLKPALMELLDSAASKEEREKIKQLILSIDGILSTHKIRSRSISGNIFLDLHVTVDGEISVTEGHILSEKVQAILKDDESLNIVDVLVHIEPHEEEL